MIKQLKATSTDDLFPIFIPSYLRPEFVTGKRLLSLFDDEALKKVHVIVRKEQAKQYRKHNPKIQVLVIPDEYNVNGLASTRQFIFDYCVEHRIPYYIDMDDDIKYLQFLWSATSANGNPTSRHSTVKDWEKHPDIPQMVLQLACKISRDCFTANSNVVFGNIRRQRMSQGEQNSTLKYMVNSGPTPRQVTFVNTRRLYKAHINRDIKRFERHGDDIGYCAVILKAGYSLFNIPCLCYDYIDEKCDSVVRTPENEKELHAYEYSMLQKYPIRDYLRTTFRDENGDYMWGDVDFVKLNKLRGTKPIKEFWR